MYKYLAVWQATGAVHLPTQNFDELLLVHHFANALALGLIAMQRLYSAWRPKAPTCANRGGVIDGVVSEAGSRSMLH